VDLALHSPAQTNIAVDVKLAYQSVARAERDASVPACGGCFGRRLIRR
jgi:hypothetical protein